MVDEAVFTEIAGKGEKGNKLSETMRKKADKRQRARLMKVSLTITLTVTLTLALALALALTLTPTLALALALTVALARALTCRSRSGSLCSWSARSPTRSSGRCLAGTHWEERSLANGTPWEARCSANVDRERPLRRGS